MAKNKSLDAKQYEKYKEIIGKENMPKTLAKFKDMKYNDVEKWELLKDYKKARNSNMISAFTPFKDYIKYKEIISREIVGLTTVDGVKIASQSKHFIERVFGTIEDPKTGRPRSGVEIKDIKEALMKGTFKYKDDSVTYFASKCQVSVNHVTGNLIQTNPAKKRKREK